MVRSGNTPMTGVQRSVNLSWLWLAGLVVWCPMVLLLWWHLYEAQTFAQASLFSTRLAFVSTFGIFWSIAGARWQARLKKTRTI
jgi:hypothetical protein